MALIPYNFIDSVVALGTIINGKQSWIGTGFLFGNYSHKGEDELTYYDTYLVTNKHVLKNSDNIIVRFNPQLGQSGRDYAAKLSDENGRLIWVGHPEEEIDVAVLSVDINILKNQGMKCGFFRSDFDSSLTSQLMEMEVLEGDFIYALGFPLGMIANDRQDVFVRGGVISRIKDLFEKRNKDFVIDAVVFPGNSGGPVILKPELTSLDGTKFHTNALLIGIVKSYIPYIDVAISQQTNRPRITFEENSGLTPLGLGCA